MFFLVHELRNALLFSFRRFSADAIVDIIDLASIFSHSFPLLPGANKESHDSPESKRSKEGRKNLSFAKKKERERCGEQD